MNDLLRGRRPPVPSPSQGTPLGSRSSDRSMIERHAMSANPRVEQFLDLSRLGGSGRAYTIGPFFSNGVTLLKQQIRALNLVYSLATPEPPLLTVETSLAVIGGCSPA